MEKAHFTAAIESDSIDIDDYLPVTSSDEAKLFCTNHDGLLDLRKKAVLRRVYSAADTSTLTAFVASVTDIFFSESFQIAHRWPARQ